MFSYFLGEVWTFLFLEDLGIEGLYYWMWCCIHSLFLENGRKSKLFLSANLKMYDLDVCSASTTPVKPLTTTFSGAAGDICSCALAHPQMSEESLA